MDISDLLEIETLSDRHEAFLQGVEDSSERKGLFFEEVNNCYSVDFRKTEILIGESIFFVVSFEDDTIFYGINELH